VRCRRLLLAAAAALLMLTLGGCLAFEGATTATTQPLGPVVVRTAVCGSDAKAPATRGCADDGNSNTDADEIIPEGGFPMQVLLGYRVPAGTGAPAAFTAELLTFTRNPTYASELQRHAPAAAGSEWVGYASNAFNYDPRNSAQDIRFVAEVPFELPRSPDGAPFGGPFRYRPVVGVRFVGNDPASPVRCGANLFAIDPLNGVCVDSPSPNAVASSLTVATSDLGIVPGPDVTATPGSTVTIPFSARYAGGAAANFTVRASTGVPGGTATPSLGSLAPAADSDNPVRVTVDVPAGTAPGRYPVTLAASLDPQRTRTGTATIVVPQPPPPPPPPGPTPRIGSPVENTFRTRGALTRVIRLRVRDVPRGGAVRVLCTGRGCPFRSRRFTGTRVNVGKAFKKRLRAGARIEVRITAPGAIGKVVRYKMRRGKAPRTTRLCLPPGATRPRARC
jgi:hypothetical protein